MRWWSWRRRPLLSVVGDAGTGPVIVLIHGIASSSVTFEKLVPLLAGDHRVISIDLLGFGASVAPDEASFTMEEHTRYLARTIASLKLREPFTLVGHSMGSLIATRYASRHSRRLKRLVLVSPPIYVTPAAVASPIDRAAMGLYLKVYEFLRANKEFTMRSAASLERLAPIRNVVEVTEQNWRAFTNSLEKAIESQTTISDLAAVTVPVDIVYGTLDPFLAHAGLRIAEQLRGVTTHRVEAADHVIRARLARVVANVIRAEETRQAPAEEPADDPAAGGEEPR